MAVEKLTKEVMVAKEASEIGEAVAAPIVELLKAYAGDKHLDAAEVMAAVMNAVPGAMQALDNAKQMSVEADEALPELINALTLPVLSIVAEVLTLIESPAPSDGSDAS